MDDQKIIELFFKRGEEAITATSEKYGKMCRSISDRILKNNEDAEECVNDTYLTLWDTIPPEEPNPFVAYICRIVRNLSLKRYRHNTAEKRNSYYDASLDEISECVAADGDVDERITAQELTDILNSFLEGLKKVDRVMFVKKYWFCMEISEIAGEMSLSTNYVNVHLHRTRERLKQYLVKENWHEERIG